jgi:hypothetical protein
LVANTDVTIQAPIDEYYQNLAVRLDELKREFTNIEARQGHEQTFEDYIQGDREFAEGVQQNSQRYYDALKVLRADTQVTIHFLPLKKANFTANFCSSRCLHFASS